MRRFKVVRNQLVSNFFLKSYLGQYTNQVALCKDVAQDGFDFGEGKNGGCDSMLKPLTKKMTDESEGNNYRFTFYCDLCGSRQQSVLFQSDIEGSADMDLKEREHFAAYERANREAYNWFSRCPVCGKVVCDSCFRVEETDSCKECAEK